MMMMMMKMIMIMMMIMMIMTTMYRLTNNGDGCIKCPVGTTPSQDGFRCEGGENNY